MEANDDSIILNVSVYKLWENTEGWGPKKESPLRGGPTKVSQTIKKVSLWIKSRQHQNCSECVLIKIVHLSRIVFVGFFGSVLYRCDDHIFKA